MICETCKGAGIVTGRYRVGYEAGRPFIICLGCGLTSYNRNDVAQRFCGNCGLFLDDPRPCPGCGGSGRQHCCEGPVGGPYETCGK